MVNFFIPFYVLKMLKTFNTRIKRSLVKYYVNKYLRFLSELRVLRVIYPVPTIRHKNNYEANINIYLCIPVRCNSGTKTSSQGWNTALHASAIILFRHAKGTIEMIGRMSERTVSLSLSEIVLCTGRAYGDHICKAKTK